jgi:hypothetical protein
MAGRERIGTAMRPACGRVDIELVPCPAPTFADSCDDSPEATGASGAVGSGSPARGEAPRREYFDIDS